MEKVKSGWKEGGKEKIKEREQRDRSGFWSPFYNIYRVWSFEPLKEFYVNHNLLFEFFEFHT